jgi:hypothetical protein
MADTDSFSDEYVANILAKDAERSAIKYSALGMEAFLPSKYYHLCYLLKYIGLIFSKADYK